MPEKIAGFLGQIANAALFSLVGITITLRGEPSPSPELTLK